MNHFSNVRANGISSGENIAASVPVTAIIRGVIAPAIVVGLFAPASGGNARTVGIWDSEGEAVFEATGHLYFQVIGADEAPSRMRDRLSISVTTND